MKRRAFSIAITSLCLATASFAKKDDETVPDANLSSVKIGDIISGEKVDIATLTGKVVVLDYWGRN